MCKNMTYNFKKQASRVLIASWLLIICILDLTWPTGHLVTTLPFSSCNLGKIPSVFSVFLVSQMIKYPSLDGIRNLKPWSDRIKDVNMLSQFWSMLARGYYYKFPNHSEKHRSWKQKGLWDSKAEILHFAGIKWGQSEYDGTYSRLYSEAGSELAQTWGSQHFPTSHSF